MPMIEVDEATYRTQLKDAEDALKVINAAGSNSKTRTQFLHIMKTLNPNVAIPEIDAAAPLYTALQERDKKLVALEAEIKKDRDDRAKERMDAKITTEVESGRALLRKRGYQDEGVAAVEKLMQEKGIPDYDIAETYFVKMNPPAEPGVPTTGNYGRDFGLATVAEGDADHKLLMDNPTAWKNKEIGKWIAERHNQRRPV